MDSSKHSLSINIADVVVRVDSAVDFRRFNDFGFYKDFIVKNNASPDCRLSHKIGPPPWMKTDGGHFGPHNWRLSKSGARNVLQVGPPPKKRRADNVVVFNSDYSEGEMYQKSVFELFRRFIDQFLIINLLSQRNGFLLHASGIVREGKGLCFIGPSGAGKSTLLNLLSGDVKKKELLNDDRLATRNDGNGWRIFGTPWYGESRVATSTVADLSTLFFINHSKHNYVRKLSAGEICRQLMVHAFVPFWDEEATSRVLSSFQSIIQEIPAFEMGFLPDKSAVDLIKKTVLG